MMILVLSLAVCFATQAQFKWVGTTVTPISEKKAAALNALVTKVHAGSWCSSCVSFISQAIDQLLNIILNGGVIGSCAQLCGYLDNSLEEQVCNVLCDIVGIEAFIKLLSAADPDPIYICEELDQLCPINDKASANITSLAVSPASGPAGTTFSISALYTVKNPIGTGQFVLACLPPNGDGDPFGDANLLVEVPAGTYSVNHSSKRIRRCTSRSTRASSKSWRRCARAHVARFGHTRTR